MAHFAATWLLPIFFLLIGIELRHEVKVGAFKKRSDLLIPFTAATFGVIVPFLIYEIFVFLFDVSHSGWGVVVATDLPLALVALKIFNKQIASQIRPYLLSLAIFDDLISILLIAIIYNQNGVHPTVYGFLVGLLIPIKFEGNLFNLLVKLTNFIILPIFVITTIIEKLTFEIGLMTLAVLFARMAGKPIGIFLGDLLAKKVLRSEIISAKEVLAVGTLATLGLSVSLLFAEIANAPGIATASVLITIPIALIRIKILGRSILKR